MYQVKLLMQVIYYILHYIICHEVLVKYLNRLDLFESIKDCYLSMYKQQVFIFKLKFRNMSAFMHNLDYIPYFEVNSCFKLL